MVAVVVLPGWLFPYVVGAELASTVWWLHFTMIQTSGLMGRVSGIMAEQWTVDELGGLRSRDWHLVNHVMLEYVDVDHVLIGPGGLFAVETKFRSNWQFAKGEFSQIARAAAAAARDPRVRVGTKSDVATPLVVMWGPHIKRDFDQPFDVEGVTFCPGHRLVEHISAYPEKMTSDSIDAAFARLDHYVRQRDVGELRDSGPVPRPMSDVVNDIAFTAVAVIVALMLIFLPIRIEPTAVWSVVAAVLLAAGSFVVRTRARKSVRSQAITAGTTAASVGIAVILLAVIAVSHL